jgi:IPT/TIG domain
MTCAVLAGAALVVLHTGSAAVISIEVTPDKASSGQTVFLRMKNAGFADPGAIKVTIGDRAAPVVRIVDSNTIEVLIPKLPEGRPTIKVSYTWKTSGSGLMTITPPRFLRVFLRMENHAVAIEGLRPYNGEYDFNATSGRRVSFDVLGDDEVLIYTGAIPHPESATIEVFGPPGDPSPLRVPVREPYHFQIKIPYTAERAPAKLRLYDAPDGADLSADGRRKERTFITEIKLEAPKDKQRPRDKP